MSFVKFEDVGKIYKTGDVEVRALHDVSFEIEKGEICVVVGQSGAGKTTLLNILGGMDTLSEGRVTLDGRDISALTTKQMATYRRWEIGFVFQFYNLIPNLTALENVEIASQLSKKPLRSEAVMKAVGLADRMDNFPAQLSGGEQQRVAIARALVNSPRMIIADEPTGNLDPVRSLELMLLLEKINELGTTVLVVTHEKELVNAFSKRVVAIDEGHVISDGMDGYYNYE